MNIAGKVAAFLLMLIPPAEAAVISGTVTGPDGITGLAGIEVTTWLKDGNAWYYYNAPVTTDATGHYLVDWWDFETTGLPLGEYRIEFHDPSGSYAMEVYNDALSFWQGDEIVISNENQVATGIDASLAVGSSIAGKITGPDGVTPLAGIEVSASVWSGSEWYWMAWVDSDSSGNYVIAGLPVGNYMIGFYDSSGGYARETYDNVVSSWEGTEIVIASAGQTVSGIDASLSTASSISGKITGPDGTTPLENIEAEAWIWDGGDWSWLAWGFSDSNGNYTLAGLPPGNYKIEFYDSSGFYATEAYDDTMFWNASELTVPANTVIPGIDASLDLASHISGTVTGADGSSPLAYIEAAAYSWNGADWEPVEWAGTDTNGYYEIGGLPPGTYQVDFYDYDGAYAYEVYNDEDVLGAGSNIMLSAAQTVGNINASLHHVSPVVVGFARTGSHAYQVDFTGIPGEQYILQETSSLLSGWSGVGSPIVCGAGTNHVPIISDVNEAFWRILQMP